MDSESLRGVMVYLIAIISALTGFLFGFDEGIMSGVLHAIQQDFSLTDKQTGFMMGLLPFGALLSACVTGRLADWMGRLRVLYTIPILFSVAILCICLTSSYSVLCAARLLLGISIGMSVVVSPLYIAETAPREIRGRLVTCFQLAITLGILFSYVANLINASVVTQMSWRWMFATGLVPSAVIFVGAFFLPESPRWLCSKGREEEARHILGRLHGGRAKRELEEISQTIGPKKRTHVWRDLFSKRIRPILLLGMLLFFFQQLSGINVIIYYAPTIFREIALGSHVVTLFATVGIGAINVLATLIAMRWVERLGRRPLLIWGFVGTAASLALIAVMTYLDIPQLRWVSVASLCVYIIAFAASLGPLPWVMMPEIFPLHVRGQGSSLSAGSNWAFNTLVVATFPIFLQNFGISLTFALYALACVLGLLFTIRYVPETKRLSLERIEKHVRSGKAFRLLGR